MDKVAIISGFYGSDQNITFKGYRNKNYPSYYITNNLKAAAIAEKFGWIVHFDNDTPVTEDKHIASIQSKKIKAIPSKILDLNDYDYTLYVDDKIKISDSYLIKRELPRLKKNKNKVSLRAHWKSKNAQIVWHELTLSLIQPRYREKFDNYCYYIKKKMSEGYSDEGYLSATGVILLNNRDNEIKKVFQEWYDEIVKYNLANCQIAFFFLRKKYPNLIDEMLFPVNYKQLYTSKLIDLKNYLAKKHFY
jgi:hypothetical protein